MSATNVILLCIGMEALAFVVWLLVKRYGINLKELDEYENSDNRERGSR
jgi:hypothetical protein